MAPRPGSLPPYDSSLLADYDPRSVQRGLAYALEGRAIVTETGDGWATGLVQGTDVEPYDVDLHWTSGPRGLRIDDECSCPLGGSCKHAVALIVTLTRPTAAGPAMAVPTLLRSADLRPNGLRPVRATNWRRALDAFDDGDPTEPLPLALELSLVDARPTRYAPDPAPRIQVRPMRMGARGRWVKSGASWREVSSSYHWQLNDADQGQLDAIRAMHAAASGPSYLANDASMRLDQFGPGLWTSLRHAADAGVALITDRDSGSVVIADSPAQLDVDMVGVDGDDVEVTLLLTHEGRPLRDAPGHAIPIGSPVHGLAVIHGVDIGLIPLERPIPHAVAELLDAPPIRVPSSDVDELIDVYQPRLARSAHVGSSDGSVTIETNELEGIVAHVERPSVGAAVLRWKARYRRGRRVQDHPLLVPIGSGRDLVAERDLVAGIELPVRIHPAVADVAGRPADLAVNGADAVVLLTEVVPWLTERGQVIVEVHGDVPDLRRAIEDPLIALEVADAAGEERNDWFDLSIEVSVDGEPVEFARLFTALSNDESVLVLDSGTWIDLDRPELDRLRELIDEARGLVDDDDGDGVRINRFQASWWDELTGLGVVASQSQRWVDSVGRLQDLTAPTPVDVPAGLVADLRHYQREGLDWLAFLHANGLGGILADDMGLGKTVQTLALFLHVLEREPDARFLVVAPTSVVENWAREVQRFAPGVGVRTIHETARRRGSLLADAVGDARIVVTSYALFRLEFDDYQALDWDILVLDEAQFVKNHHGKTYQCVRRLDAPMKLAITGTPIENSLMDLWSLLSITAPGLYPDPRRFSEVYRKPIESGRAPTLLATLRRRVAPLMRRRTKDEVLTELPPKTEQTVEVELSARHMRIYEAQLQRQRQKVLGLVGDVQKNRFEILKSLTILRQLSLDPGLVDPDHDDIGSAKLDQLITDLTQVIAEGHRALVFSQFTRYLSRVRARLDEAGIAYAYLDGRTRRRDEAISRFTDGDVPVFVISLKAGGFGLNLTQADYCFVLDPWWNPAAETQAVDRTHRIGQVNPVVVYRYVSVGTIEEKVMELKARKSALFSSVMDADDALAGALDADDIRALIDGA